MIYALAALIVVVLNELRKVYFKKEAPQVYSTITDMSASMELEVSFPGKTDGAAVTASILERMSTSDLEGLKQIEIDPANYDIVATVTVSFRKK